MQEVRFFLQSKVVRLCREPTCVVITEKGSFLAQEEQVEHLPLFDQIEDVVLNQAASSRNQMDGLLAGTRMRFAGFTVFPLKEKRVRLPSSRRRSVNQPVDPRPRTNSYHCSRTSKVQSGKQFSSPVTLAWVRTAKQLTFDCFCD